MYKKKRQCLCSIRSIVVRKKPSAEFQKNFLIGFGLRRISGFPSVRACLPCREWTRFRRTCCFQKMGLTAVFVIFQQTPGMTEARFPANSVPGCSYPASSGLSTYQSPL